MFFFWVLLCRKDNPPRPALFHMAPQRGGPAGRLPFGIVILADVVLDAAPLDLASGKDLLLTVLEQFGEGVRRLRGGRVFLGEWTGRVAKYVFGHGHAGSR